MNIGVIMYNRKEDALVYQRKCAAISHAIISAVRPRSFVSSIQIATSMYIHRKFESKELISILSSLGLAASYYDVRLFEACSLFQIEERILDGTFCQYIFDNAILIRLPLMVLIHCTSWVAFLSVHRLQ